MAIRNGRTAVAVLVGGLFLAGPPLGGCDSGPPMTERSGLVYDDLPAPVRAAWEQDHRGAVIYDVTERRPAAGLASYALKYKKPDPTGDGFHTVEYNAGGDEISSK